MSKKFHVHVFKVIAEGDITIDAKNEEEARQMAIDLKKKIIFKHSDNIKYLAINVGES